ncbi:MAG: acyl-CoA dehydrogenase family protein [Halieaceae bacterium]|nr:acyl-CoA dehydrogenase family protein [Halieaceae bacterium]
MSSLSDEDRLLIEGAAGKFIQDNYPFSDRETRAKQDGKFGRHWSVFAELGWLALPFASEVGGLGGCVVDTQVLAREFGRGLIAEPWLETMTAGKVIEHGAARSEREALLAGLMGGEFCLLLAHGERKVDLNFEHVCCTATESSSGYSINGVKRVIWQAAAADKYLVTTKLNGVPALFLVDKDASGLTLYEYPNVDSRHAADIHLEQVAVQKDALLGKGESAETGVLRAILFAFGTIIGEVRGIADTLIELTAEYMRTREQFGTKIGHFQALQHMLADMVIAKEEIQSLEWISAASATIDDIGERERIARSAKARTSTVARGLAETAVQIHGGIGLSDEFVVGHYLRRLLAIDALYGDGQQQMLWLASRY